MDVQEPPFPVYGFYRRGSEQMVIRNMTGDRVRVYAVAAYVDDGWRAARRLRKAGILMGVSLIVIAAAILYAFIGKVLYIEPLILLLAAWLYSLYANAMMSRLQVALVKVEARLEPYAEKKLDAPEELKRLGQDLLLVPQYAPIR